MPTEQLSSYSLPPPPPPSPSSSNNSSTSFSSPTIKQQQTLLLQESIEVENLDCCHSLWMSIYLFKKFIWFKLAVALLMQVVIGR